jgi:hypothetical protein
MTDSSKSADAPREKKPALDRVTLGASEALKIDMWLAQLKEATKGYLVLSRSDAVNFLVRKQADEFSSREAAQIRAEHYDPIRYITWITPQIKEALSSGDVARVAALQEELRRVELSFVKSTLASIAGPGEKAQARRTKNKQKTDSKSVPTEVEKDVRIDDIGHISREA